VRVFSVEVILGVAILFMTSLLIITSPPYPPLAYTFGKSIESQGASVKLSVAPYEQKNFLLSVSYSNEQSLPVGDVLVKATNEDTGLGPISVPVEKRFPGAYVFPRSALSPDGRWLVSVTTLRPGMLDASASFFVDYPLEVDQTYVDPDARAFGWFELSLSVVAILVAALAVFMFFQSTKRRAQLLSFLGHKHRALQPHIPPVLVPSAIIVYGILFHVLAFVGMTGWFLQTDFQKNCGRDGNMWEDALPIRDGTALSDGIFSGCTLTGGLYHFADQKEYEFFTRPPEE